MNTTDHGPQRQPASVPQIEAQRKQTLSLYVDSVTLDPVPERIVKELASLRVENQSQSKEIFELLIKLNSLYATLHSLLDALELIKNDPATPTEIQKLAADVLR